MTSLLTINCIAAEAPRRDFDEHVLPRVLTRWSGEHRVAHLVSDEVLPTHDGYSHLLLNGSELSAARENPRDTDLIRCIRSFADADKPVYGICYGHQMIARALGGACRRAAVPEFGWRRVRRVDNPLWRGLEDMITVHSHYDEVHDLPDAFEVIASTDDCDVQAFQLRGARVWGTQFHPEFSASAGTAMLQDNLRTEALAPRHFVDELDDPVLVEANLALFANFFASGSAGV
ncbi:MAG: gamma-glutamyl-gamma-aminobutyrate hydrolase family protein [Planctomycetes bacterium]|nr:gamma-glutamyl-gamma-aminobutyrate hydrolase family protein [Planctomycetota bacterium]MCB9902957.1 gamma-glutamyl-gamma-aminobutyrate hydrolase family protein [Planctomycetota bacterium]